MPGSAHYLPVWKLRDIIGAEAADILLSKLGGRKVYVSTTQKEGSKIIDLIGGEAARKLSDHLAIGEKQHIGALIELPRGQHSSKGRHDRRITQLIEDGATDAAIMAELGVVDRTIRRWRERLGKGRASKPGPQDARLAAMVRDPKLTVRQIADCLGLSGGTVLRWRRRLAPALIRSIRKRSAPIALPSARIMRLLPMLDVATKDIAEQAGVKVQTVQKWRRELRQGKLKLPAKAS